MKISGIVLLAPFISRCTWHAYSFYICFDSYPGIQFVAVGASNNIHK